MNTEGIAELDKFIREELNEVWEDADWVLERFLINNKHNMVKAKADVVKWYDTLNEIKGKQ